MLNISFNQNPTSTGTIMIIIAILLSSITIIFDLIIIVFLIYHGQFTKCYHKNNSRHVGILHSINTYTHLVGILSTLLIMCLRTLLGDLSRINRDVNFPSWHCLLLAYLLSLFAAGVYGSCFLQALFRFWRIIKPNRGVFQKLSFHIRLIFVHWILIIILLLPIFPRSIYISSDSFCLSSFDDRWTAAYISSVTTTIPVIGIFILYIKIVIYMKHHLQTKKQLKRIKRNLSGIRRILLLVIVILLTSSMGIILWILTLFDKRFHTLFYRSLRFLVILCMVICSIALLMLSPQLKRTLRSNSHKRRRQSYIQKQNISSNNMIIEEIIPVETLSI